MKGPLSIAIIRVWIFTSACLHTEKGLENAQTQNEPMLDQEDVPPNRGHIDMDTAEMSRIRLVTELGTGRQDDSYSEKVRSKVSHQFENTGVDEAHFKLNDEMAISDSQREAVKSGHSKHGDYFPCPPCYRCSHTNKGFPIANCTFSNLRNLPRSLPRDVWRVNATGNHLEYLNTSDLTWYPDMTIIDLSKNKLVKIFGDLSNKVSLKLETLILDYNKIAEISAGSFNSLTELKCLKIRKNCIKVINSTTFQSLEKLMHLDLSWNLLVDIQRTSLSFSKELRHLFLNNNKLSYDKFRNLEPFGNLTNLLRLRIQGNVHARNYPNEFLGNLRNLQDLFIDGLVSSAEFGLELRKLKYLETLSFGPNPNCQLKSISSTFFNNVPFLKSLTFDNCLIRDIDQAAFHQLPNLTKYSLIGEKMYDLDKAFASLCGLQNSSLRHVAFVHLYRSAPMCRTLSRKQGIHIEKLSLEELNLSDNRLALLQNDFIECIPKTLKRFTLAGNKFSTAGNVWSRFLNLSNLVYLDMRNQNQDTHWLRFNIKSQIGLPKSISQSRESHRQGRGSISDQVKHYWPISHAHKRLRRSNESINVKFSHNPGLSNAPIKASSHIHRMLRLTLLIPPNLQDVRASGYMYFGYVLFFHFLKKPNNLLNLDFARSFLTNWGAGRLPVSVKTLNLSDNYCSVLSPRFFPRGSHLITLKVKRNFLGEDFNRDKHGDLFLNLRNLLYLDISTNSIFALPINFFRGLEKLKFLKISDNKLSIFNMNVSYMKDLRYLDLSKNSISWIEKAVRHQLDAISRLHTIKIDLTDNPLPCTCRGIELLEWMANTNVCLLSQEYLHCHTDEGKDERIGNFSSRVRELKHQCVSYAAIIAGGAAGGGAFLLAIALGIIIYKGRWHIMYSFNNGFLTKLFGFKPRIGRKPSFKFDAYVVYEEDDRDFVLQELLPQLETKRGHALCLEDRDFIPGTLNFNNIINAVQNSHVVLFVISPDFANSKDFEYTIHMALMEEYNTKEKREVCKLLVYRPTPTKTMSKELQMLLMKGRFLEYPVNKKEGCSSQDMLNNFWDRLSNELCHTATKNATETDTQSLLS